MEDLLTGALLSASLHRILAGVSLLLLVLSVTLFATLMLLPLRGSPPNVSLTSDAEDPLSFFGELIRPHSVLALSTHAVRSMATRSTSEAPHSAPHFELGRGLHHPLPDSFAHLCVSSNGSSPGKIILLNIPAASSPCYLHSPPPPSTSLATRLTDASRAAGGNLQAASKGIQSLVTEIASSVGLGFNPSSPSSSQTYLASLKSSDLLEKLRLTSAQGLASRLGVSSGRAEEFTVLLDEYQERAKIWAEGGARYAGWAGAVGGAVGVYLLVLGVVGLLGVFTTPLSKRAKKDGKGKAAEVTDVSPTSTPIPKPVRNLRPHDAAPNAPLTPL